MKNYIVKVVGGCLLLSTAYAMEDRQEPDNITPKTASLNRLETTELPVSVNPVAHSIILS